MPTWSKRIGDTGPSSYIVAAVTLEAVEPSAHDACSFSDIGRLKAIAHAELAKDVGDMQPGRLLGDEQLLRDLAVRPSCRYELEDLDLAAGQAEWPFRSRWRPGGLDLLEWHAGPLSELLDSVKQRLRTKSGRYAVRFAEDRAGTGSVTARHRGGGLTPAGVRNGVWPAEHVPRAGRFFPSRWIGGVLQPGQLGTSTGELGEHRWGRGSASCVHLLDEHHLPRHQVTSRRDGRCKFDIQPPRPRPFRTIGLRPNTERQEWSHKKRFLRVGSPSQSVTDRVARCLVVALP
jgi:hypothetical protein